MIRRIRSAKSRKLADVIRKELSSIRTFPGMPAASASELAREYGISVPTAHNVLNILAKEGLLYRVRGSGTFFSGSREKKLRIGIADQTVSPEYLSPDINRILDYHFDCAAEYFRSHDCQVRIILYSELMAGGALLDLDALLISALYLDSDSIKLLQTSRIPVLVYRSDYLADYQFPSLVYDRGPGMREALNFLKPAKENRIILIMETTPCGRHVKSKWHKTLKAFDVPDSRIVNYDINVVEREISCYRLVRVHRELFRNAIILTCNDEVAMNVVNALTLENMRGGIDYRLVGIGNRAGYGYPTIEKLQIASIDTPIRQMAQEAARQLLARLKNHSDCNCSVMIPTHFIPRASAGYVRNEKECSGLKNC